MKKMHQTRCKKKKKVCKHCNKGSALHWQPAGQYWIGDKTKGFMVYSYGPPDKAF